MVALPILSAMMNAGMNGQVNSPEVNDPQASVFS